MRTAYLAIALICSATLACPALAASPIKGAWKVDAIAALPNENVRLNDKEKQVVAVVNKARIVRLKDALSRIQGAAGITAEFWIVQLTDSKPNAFATSKDGRNYVLVSLTMLDLLGDDMDAYAFLFGHEIAHNVKQHGAEKAARKGFLQGLGFIASFVIGAKTGYNVGGLTDLGADLIDKTYNRDQEREADQLGLSYMVASGFNPQGAITLQRSLAAVSGSSQLAFFSTHPSGQERIANLEKMIASLPSPSIPKVQTTDTTVIATTSNSAIAKAISRDRLENEPSSANLSQLPPCPGNYDSSTWTSCSGEFSFSDGWKYVGEFKDGKRNGQGTELSPTGIKYVGEYSNDKRNGHGTVTFPNGENYVGDFKDDRASGQGTFTSRNGDKYIGEHKDNDRHGKGIQYRADGSILQSGNWENNTFVGVD